MLSLLDWLRRLDARLLSAVTPAGAPSDLAVRLGAVLAVLGGCLVLAAGVLLQEHALAQLGALGVGMLLTVPYLQHTFDKAVGSLSD
jgi:hypothetical protein